MSDIITPWVIEGIVLGPSIDTEDIALFRKVVECIGKISPITPPFGVILDIQRILTKKSLLRRDIQDLDMMKVLLTYEEQFLGRIQSDYRLESCRDILSNLDKKNVPLAIATFIDQVFARLKLGFLESPSFSLVQRSLNSLSSDGILEQVSALQSSFDTQRKSYEEITKLCRQAGSIISDSEVYVLSNVDVLTSNSQRLAITMIADASQQISRFFPNQAGKKRDRGSIRTNLNDPSSYPIGGFSGITTRGDIESLVGSELIYMEDGEIDLFDIKYSSNELLKYERDESVHLRETRSFFFFFEGLSSARRKDPLLPYQRLVLLLGGTLAGVQKLIRWLESSELTIELIFDQELKEEQKLMTLLMREHIKKGTVLIKSGTFDETQNQILERAETSLVDVLRVNTNPSPSVDSQEYLQYHLQVQGSPLFSTPKTEIESGSTLLDWGKLFSFIFQGMV